jgi:hypothetical protein
MGSAVVLDRCIGNQDHPQAMVGIVSITAACLAHG